METVESRLTLRATRFMKHSSSQDLDFGILACIQVRRYRSSGTSRIPEWKEVL